MTDSTAQHRSDDTVDALNAVARNLSAARIGMKLSQDELAKMAGLSRATIVQLESGEGDPQLSTIAKLADALEITPALLFIGRQEIEAIAEISRTGGAHQYVEHLTEQDHNNMVRLIRSGIPKNRNKAIAMGTSSALAAGLAARALAGTAIGSALIPGVGTAVGAAIGAWLLYNKMKDGDEK